MSIAKAVGAVIAAVAVFVAVKAAPIIVGWVIGHEGAKMVIRETRSPASSYTPDRTSDMLHSISKENGTKYLKVLEESFPEDYRTMMDQFTAEIARGGSKVEAERFGHKISADIRKKYASNILTAPDRYVKDAIGAQLTILEEISKRDGQQLCARFAMAGGSALLGRSSSYLRELDEAAVAVLRAVNAGRKTPEAVGPATDEDWMAIGKRFLADGGTVEEIDILGAVNDTHPSFCAITIRFMRSVYADDTLAGRRVRAHLAYAAASN